MKDRDLPSSAQGRSRLDPAPVGRRDFLGLAAKGTAATAGAVALIGLLRLPKAAVLPSPSRRFQVTLPETLRPGEVFVPPDRQVALLMEASGEVVAISTVCTHLGCIVHPTPEGFDCPCHGSKFGPGGDVTRGPALKALPWLEVQKVGPGIYQIDEGKIVPSREVKGS